MSTSSNVVSPNSYDFVVRPSKYQSEFVSASNAITNTALIVNVIYNSILQSSNVNHMYQNLTEVLPELLETEYGNTVLSE